MIVLAAEPLPYRMGSFRQEKGRNYLKVRVERKIGAGILSIETGELAKQAAGSCLVQYGETVVLVAAASGPPAVGGDFFPLTCDYRERVAAAGKFPGGFLKREGRPTTKEILTARLMDRPIRPQFPEGYFDEVQIQSFVLASDRQNDGDVLAMNGASAALVALAAALPGTAGLGAAGLHQRRVRCLPHARPAGRERPGPDRLGQQGRHPDDRGFRPRNARKPHGPRPSPRPTSTSARSARCRIELAQKAGAVKAAYTVAEPNPLIETIRAEVFRRRSSRPSRPRASRPGPRPWRP